jgi:hypothetical protein
MRMELHTQEKTLSAQIAGEVNKRQAAAAALREVMEEHHKAAVEEPKAAHALARALEEIADLKAELSHALGKKARAPLPPRPRHCNPMDNRGQPQGKPSTCARLSTGETENSGAPGDSMRTHTPLREALPSRGEVFGLGERVHTPVGCS